MSAPVPEAPSAIEARAALLLRVRQGGVRDIEVLRAIETVPRELFTPHRFRDLAERDIALPIGCGQTMPSAIDLGRRLDALAPRPGQRVLEIGTGSGYGTAILARIAREVVSMERFETLAIEAGRRLAALPAENALVLFGDGLAPSRSLGAFDRIIVHASLPQWPEALSQLLAPSGIMVFGKLTPGAAGQRPSERLVRATRDAGGIWREADLGPCRLGAATPGAALAL